MEYVDWAIRSAIASSRIARCLDIHLRPLNVREQEQEWRPTSNSEIV